jgi:osmotically-inducible protein OsmY
MKRTYAMTLVAALLLAGGCASNSKQETTGQYIDDSSITAHVKKAIFDEPTLKVTQINVETYKAVVQLSGFVDTSSQVGTAGSLARAVQGVASVKNDIRVKQ